MFKTGDLYLANYNSTSHVVVNQGGTSSGKTYAIIQVLFVLAAENAKSVVTVVGQDIPNLKVGALRDALNIYDDSRPLRSLIQSYNKTDRVFYFRNGSKIEFNSYDNAQDAKSGKRHYLFINEANGIPFEHYTELALRTSKKIFIDYNPNSRFWVHDNIIGSPTVELIISDHRHNPFLPDIVRNKIEALKQIDEELWRVYARGLTGKIAGLIYSNWVECDEIPPQAKRIAVGLDFGFTNDPTAAIDVYMQNGELWLDELIYETGLTNPKIASEFERVGLTKQVEIIADSAEPKSIFEIRAMKWNIQPANKGADSVKNGIDILKRYKLNITRRSKNLKRELLAYKWRVDKVTGNTLNEPIDAFNHLLDPLRYVALNKLKIQNRTSIRKIM